MGKNKVRLEWMDNVVVMAGNWEPLAHRRRAVCGAVDDEHVYELEHSPEMVSRLIDAGVTAVVWHFFKGFGLEFEKEEMNKTAKFSQLCHEKGIKVGTYINFGSIYPSTFFLEKPEAKDWLAVDAQGQPHSYSEFFRCYYRYRLCMSNYDYRQYIKEISLKAVQQCQSDWIHFDNNAQMACYCDNCRQGFNKYLNGKFSKNAEIRFGHKYIERLELPKGTQRMGIDTLVALHEPVLQEWVNFRCDLLADAIGEVSNAIKDKYPDTVIGINPSFDAGEFGPLLWGTDVEKLAEKADVLWSEDTNWAGVNKKTSAITGRLFTFKYGSSLNTRIAFHQTGATHTPENFRNCELSLFESAVFNNGFLGHTYHAPDLINVATVRSPQRQIIDFIKTNNKYFCNTKHINEIALLRSDHSQKIRWLKSLQSRVFMEQILVQYGFQFDIICQDRLTNLEKYKVLILPNTSCLSDKDINYIKVFINNGGKLVATEDSAMCDDWSRARASAGLMKFYGESQQENSMDKTFETRKNLLCKILDIDPKNANRVFYIPSLKSSDIYSHSFRDTKIPIVDSQYWRLPENADDVAKIIKTALDNEPLVEISSPQIIAQLSNIKNSKNKILHLLNYNISNPVKDLNVRIRPEILNGLSAIKELSIKQNSSEIEFKKTGSFVEFTVDSLDVYKGIIFEY